MGVGFRSYFPQLLSAAAAHHKRIGGFILGRCRNLKGGAHQGIWRAMILGSPLLCLLPIRRIRQQPVLRCDFLIVSDGLTKFVCLTTSCLAVLLDVPLALMNEGGSGS